MASSGKSNIPVTFTYDNGKAEFSVPSLRVKNNSETITWTLSNQSTSGVSWPATNGIVFTPSWTNAGNSQPTYNASNQTYNVTDNNNVTSATNYNYTVTVNYGGQSYSSDPDVTNSPPG